VSSSGPGYDEAREALITLLVYESYVRLVDVYEAARGAPGDQEPKAFCDSCGNYHPIANHPKCAANLAAGLHAEGFDPTYAAEFARDLGDQETP
jgi:hypothetical protein